MNTDAMNTQQEDQDLYAVLGVTRGASSERIRAAYLAEVKLHHPDRFSSASTPTSDARIRALTHAYSILSSPVSRTTYDVQTSSRFFHTSQSAAQARRISAYVDVERLTVREVDEEGAEVLLCSLACRCGADYVVSAAALERGERDVACSGCSLVIRVVWDEKEDDEGGEGGMEQESSRMLCS